MKFDINRSYQAVFALSHFQHVVVRYSNLKFDAIFGSRAFFLKAVDS